MGSNTSLPTVASSGQEQLLQNTARDNTRGPSGRSANLQNPSLINNILGGAEGQVVRASVLSENGDISGSTSRAVSMERPGLPAVNASVRGVFVKNEPLDSGAESGGASSLTGSNGK